MRTDSSGNGGESARGQKPSREDVFQHYIAQLENPRTVDYIQHRVIPQMRWYSRKSGDCKKQYYRLMLLSIGLGAAIPVMAVFLNGPLYLQLAIALCGTSVTAVNAYLSLTNSRDLWLTYRETREILLRTLYFYFNDAEKFAGKPSEEKDLLLIEVCEAELARENGSWRSMLEK